MTTIDVLAELTPEQAHEMAPKSFSWDEAGCWAMGWKACCDANRAAVAELIEAAGKAYGHLACIGHPVDKHGRYHKDGEWTFSEAMPNPADASEAKAAFLTLRAALARMEGTK